MALSDIALVSLVEAKRHLRESKPDRDTQIEGFVNHATDWIEKETGVSFVLRTVTNELLDGSGWNELDLSKSPVASVSKVEFLTAYTPEAWEEQDAGTYPVILLGGAGILFRSLSFPLGRRNVRVTYQAGYAEVPADVTGLCLQLVKALYRKFEKNPDDSQAQTFAGNAVTLIPEGELSQMAKATIARYRRRSA